MLNYFKNVTTIEELKNTYKELAKKYHPDINPNGTEIMKEINAEYEKAFEILKTQKDIEDDFRETIDAIINLDINIEICGTWIWVSGDTKPVKDTLKASGLKWAKKKQMWFWRPADQAARRTRKTMDMEHIRDKYGSTMVKGIQTNKRAALN